MHETYVKQILSPLASILVTHINIASIHKMCVMCGSNRWFTIPPRGREGTSPGFRCPSHGLSLPFSCPYHGLSLPFSCPSQGTSRDNVVPSHGISRFFARKKVKSPPFPGGGDGKPSNWTAHYSIFTIHTIFFNPKSPPIWWYHPFLK